MGSASVAPATTGLFRRTVTALRWRLSSLVIGAPQPSTDSSAAELLLKAGVVDDTDVARVEPVSRECGRTTTPKRAAFLEEAAMAREMFHL